MGAETLRVLKKTGHAALIIALVAVLGGHWAVLQTLAWTNMLAENLRAASVTEAVEKTFDGHHPCCLCKAIAAGKNTERKSEFPLQLKKMEFVSERAVFIFSAPREFYFAAESSFVVHDFFQKPPVPPPREFSC